MDLKLGLCGLGVFAMAMVSSMVLTSLVKRAAVKVDFVARPKADRFHKSIVPMGGGVAIFATVLLFCLGAIAAVKYIQYSWEAPVVSDIALIDYLEGFQDKLFQLWGIIAAMAVLFLMGLWDDLKGLGPLFKLIVQFAVAGTAAYFADVRIEFFIENRLITSAMSAFWIVLIINAFNFLDNMDGASAGIALIVTMILFFAASMAGQVFVAGFAILFGGALAGFLVFNFFPASIFMGDAGSMVVGFAVAMLTLKTTYYQQAGNENWHVIFMPLVIMALPLYDFVSVTILRISQGKSPFVGDTQHFSHRLTRRGLSQPQAVATLYLATLCTGLGAIVLKAGGWFVAILVFAQTIMVLVIIAILEAANKNETKQQ